MNKKTILLSVVFAILVGIVFGVIIGGLSGMFLSPNSLDKDTKPGVEIADEKESLLAEEEAQKKAQQEAEAKALLEAEKKAKEQPKPQPQEQPQSPPAQQVPQQPTPQPQIQQPPAQPQAPQSTQGLVATGNGQTLNVRASSDPGSAIISSAGDGSALTIYERANGMVRVRTADGVEGWVSEQYIAG